MILTRAPLSHSLTPSKWSKSPLFWPHSLTHWHENYTLNSFNLEASATLWFSWQPRSGKLRVSRTLNWSCFVKTPLTLMQNYFKLHLYLRTIWMLLVKSLNRHLEAKSVCLMWCDTIRNLLRRGCVVFWPEWAIILNFQFHSFCLVELRRLNESHDFETSASVFSQASHWTGEQSGRQHFRDARFRKRWAPSTWRSLEINSGETSPFFPVIALRHHTSHYVWMLFYVLLPSAGF